MKLSIPKLTHMKTTILPKVRTPEDIFKLCSTVSYDNDTEMMRQPDVVLREKLAVCYDMVELQRALFAQLPEAYTTTTYYLYEDLPWHDHPTHTVFLYSLKKVVTWMEISWQDQRGMYTYSSEHKAVKKITDLLRLDWGQIQPPIQYQPFDYTGMSYEAYGEYITNTHRN